MRPEKKLIEEIYSSSVREQSGVVVADYQGLSSEDFGGLRRSIASLDADCLVVKNRLFKHILDEYGLGLLSPFIEGQTAVISTRNELPELIKVIIKYEKNQGSPHLKAAVWDGAFFSADDLKKLSELPSRDELLSRVISGMQAPLSGLVGVMNEVITGLARVIKAIGDQKAA
jgi:large subunit ribosomal protein L10